MAGPEEMKWPAKQLYTYNVQNGDAFILDEKVPLARIRTRNSSASSMSPHSPASVSPRPRYAFTMRRVENKAARNLFGDNNKKEEKKG